MVAFMQHAGSRKPSVRAGLRVKSGATGGSADAPDGKAVREFGSHCDTSFILVIGSTQPSGDPCPKKAETDTERKLRRLL
eukprot:4503548-Prymnesium_polylepis.1